MYKIQSLQDITTANNRTIVQSYAFAIAKYDFTATEFKILCRILEYSQQYLLNQKLDSTCKAYEQITIGNSHMEMIFDMYSILPEGSHHSEQCKKALYSLQDKKIEMTINEGTKEELFFRSSLIDNVMFYPYQGIALIRMSKEAWQALLDFSHGYRRYELAKILSFSSIYTMRLYVLFSQQKDEKYYTVQQIRNYLSISDDKYKLTADFIKRVIQPAQEELNQKSDYTFTFEPIKEGHKIARFKFTPVLQEKNRDEELYQNELNRQISPFYALNTTTLYYLRNVFEFSTIGIKNNFDLFYQCQTKLEDLPLLFTTIRSNIEKNNVKNKQGYLVNALKAELQTI